MAGVFDVPIPLMRPSNQQSMINAYANSALAQKSLGSIFGGLQTAFGDDNHNASGWYHKKGLLERAGGLAQIGATLAGLGMF